MATCSWVYPYCIQPGTKWLGMAPFCDEHFDGAVDAARELLQPEPVVKFLPAPKFEPWPSVVYYVTWPGHYEAEVKIGCSSSLVQRLTALRRRGAAPEVLVAEVGDQKAERRRHRQFSALRLNDPVDGMPTEMFRRAPLLDEHIAKLREACPDWAIYAKL